MLLDTYKKSTVKYQCILCALFISTASKNCIWNKYTSALTNLVRNLTTLYYNHRKKLQHPSFPEQLALWYVRESFKGKFKHLFNSNTAKQIVLITEFLTGVSYCFVFSSTVPNTTIISAPSNISYDLALLLVCLAFSLPL